MLNEILTISGKQGLFKLLSRGRASIIVEAIDETKKRLPVQVTDKVVSLGDISIFTDEAELPLREVFAKMEEKYGKEVLAFDYKKASNSELHDFFGGVIPDFDRDRVYPSHVKKICQWYNLLVTYGENDFSAPERRNSPADVEENAEAASDQAE